MASNPTSLRLRPVWLAIAWLLVALVVYLSLTPRPIEIPMDEGDKVGHVLAYATLMAMFAQLYVAGARLRAVVGLVALGIALEFVQRWTGYRTFDLWDMAADTAGVLIGWVLAPPRLPSVLSRVEALVMRRT